MKEINIYRLALIQYWISSIIPFLKFKLRTHRGFCYHFTMEVRDLTELYKLKPRNRYTESIGYWYKAGDVKSRIKLLKQAIKNCKTK